VPPAQAASPILLVENGPNACSNGRQFLGGAEGNRMSVQKLTNLFLERKFSIVGFSPGGEVNLTVRIELPPIRCLFSPVHVLDL
jgi:hypothetical protein